MTKKIIITDPTAQIDAWITLNKKQAEHYEWMGNTELQDYFQGRSEMAEQFKEFIEQHGHGEYIKKVELPYYEPRCYCREGASWD